jgi:hypothetical protein
VKSVLAGLAGALVATLGVAAWQARTAAPSLVSASNVPGLVAAPTTIPVSSALSGLPLAVRCAPGQQAVVRQLIVDGQTTAAAECVGAGGVVPIGYNMTVDNTAPDIVRWQPPRAEPASYLARERPARRVVYRESKPRRNWGKTALVIGGSAGAGAGVGALAGGKKGALIGAALGGGAASLWEALKR